MRPNCMSLQINSHWLDAVASAERDRSYLLLPTGTRGSPAQLPLPTYTTVDVEGKAPAALWRAASPTSVLPLALTRSSCALSLWQRAAGLCASRGNSWCWCVTLQWWLSGKEMAMGLSRTCHQLHSAFDPEQEDVYSCQALGFIWGLDQVTGWESNGAKLY